MHVDASNLQSVLVATEPQLSVAVLQVGVNVVNVSPLQVCGGAVQVVCVCAGVPHALPDAQVGVNVVSTSGTPFGPPPVQVVALSGQLDVLGVLPQTPAPAQVRVNVVRLPAVQVEA